MRISVAAMISRLAIAVLVVYTIPSMGAPKPAWSSKIPDHVQLPPGAIEGLYFATSVQLLQSNRIQLPIPGDKTLDIQGGLTARHPSGASVWSGQVVGDAGSSVILTQFGQAIAGVVRTGDRLYKVQQIRDEVHLLVEVSRNEPFPELDPVEADGYASAGSSSAPATDQASDDGTQIDVMVVYSTNTKNRYGFEGVNALIALAVAETNQAYQNSLIHTRLRLVHAAEVEDSSGNMSADLTALQSKTDGKLDQVHGLRDSYGADLVTWFNEAPSYCGIGYLNTGDLSFDAGYGFSIVASGCATGYYSTAHELGHNMGSHHDAANAGSSPVYSYSYGYQEPSNSFRTVMAYNCVGGCNRVQYFSNPDVTYSYVSNGQIVDTGKAMGTSVADNARSINLTRLPVSQWRTAVVGSPPSAVFSYSCDLLNCNFIDESTSNNPLISYSWNFGDGTTSDLKDPTHLYQNEGDYTVSLTVQDDTGALSVFSQPLSVTNFELQAPTTPTNFLLAPDASGVALSWTAVEFAETYLVERETRHPKNGRWTGLTQISVLATSLIDPVSSGTYHYRVSALNSLGQSATTGWTEITVENSNSGGGSGGGGGKGRKK